MINSKIFNKKEAEMANKFNVLNKGDISMTSKINYIKRGTKYIIGATILATSFNSVVFGLLEKDSDNYYQIGSSADLRDFAAIVNGGEVNAKGVLMNDIKLDKSKQWTPIGMRDNYFEGELMSCDLRTKTISGIYINNKNDGQGLFGYIVGKGKVKDIKISGSFIKGDAFVGGIAGVNEGKIEHCFIDDDVSSIFTIFYCSTSILSNISSYMKYSFN